MSDTNLPFEESSELSNSNPNGNNNGTRLLQLSIADEMKNSYLTYAMSVIVSRALPDVRDGLKPSQRRILVAMNDLNLSPGASRTKCAKICGETMGNYHPHGDVVIYPTLVRMAQEWNVRKVLIDKQGNFGSISGMPPAAMRYTEARLAPAASLLLEDLELDTVDFIPTYDEQRTEPTVLPAKFPNLLVNGSNGIAVGMATSIPTHNVSEVCDAVMAVLDHPGISPLELLTICPGPDFPTGGVICGRRGIQQGYLTGRGTITVRAKARIEETNKKSRIIITELPYQQARDDVEKKIELVAKEAKGKDGKEGKIPGIAAIHNESDLKEPVRLIVDVKKDADPEVVLNQLYQFTPLQDSFSIILLALVDGKPRIFTFKELVEEFIRHRITVLRRRTQFLLAKARKRKHTVEGLVIAHANIDEVIRTIRTSATQAEAKQRLMLIECPSAMLERALQVGFADFQRERGIRETYTLTPVQAEAILRMTLGHLVNLEQEKLGEEYRNLLLEITEYQKILADENLIRDMIRDDLQQIKAKHGDKRRTEISGDEAIDIDIEDLIEEETMVVSITQSGYIKRTPVSVYRAQKRGGKGRIGAKVAEEDPIQHLFVTTTHNYLLFFTNFGKVYWHKVYGLPDLPPTSKGRAIVNLLNLAPGEQIADCRAVRDFNIPDQYLVLATKNGLVKKTALSAFGRPLKGGLIAVKLREGDELIDVTVVGPGDELIMSTATGNAIRFRHTDVRAMGRAASGVKGIRLRKGDSVVGMIVASPDMTLLTACANGYGKRTPIGPNGAPEEETPHDQILPDDEKTDDDNTENLSAITEELPTDDVSDDSETENIADTESSDTESSDTENTDNDDLNTNLRYTTKHRGGLGLKDIKTSQRNGAVISITRVRDDDEVMMITAKGQIQRIAVSDIRVMGRNTQGVRLMNLDSDDALVAVKRIPKDENSTETPEINNMPEINDTPEINNMPEINDTPETTDESNESV
ncbi:MAG: DNA gyrase subunit A [Planctomycetaceae bacterium]|jgi:DNA gyrase subunit A|nr:DNA gyrase subunit A [Planctomycetaceae bacterium]